MARRKRPYVPKVKGCYECSQRRIDCDGTRPSCQKCVSRGLGCSGFEVKFRFRDGLPPAGKAVRRKRGSLMISSKDGFSSFLSEGMLNTMPDNYPADSIQDSIQDITQDSTQDSTEWSQSPATKGNTEKEVSDQEPELSLALSASTPSSSKNDDSTNESIQCVTQRRSTPEDGRIIESLMGAIPKSSPSPMEPWREYLLTYFSEHIAPEMVVMDDDHNGWRHLVLPMAWADDLIMNAVLSASAFHLASRGAGEHVVDPQKLYGRAIRELQQRRDLVECDHKTKQAVILTIVILLVAVMINGCSDFPIIFQMLESALKAVGGESKFLDGGETGNFFLRQIRKMRVYAAPLLSQDAGLHAIIYHGSDSFDCLHYYDQLHPTQSSTFKTIADLRQQAFDIYLDRVLAGGSSTASRGVLDRFIATVQSFTEGSLGENVLVWPVFIAALESCSLEHRAIFEQFLRRQHQRNGFGNILRALELLKTIWARKSNKDWPAILPEPQVFVM